MKTAMGGIFHRVDFRMVGTPVALDARENAMPSLYA